MVARPGVVASTVKHVASNSTGAWFEVVVTKLSQPDAVAYSWLAVRRRGSGGGWTWLYAGVNTNLSVQRLARLSGSVFSPSTDYDAYLITAKHDSGPIFNGDPTTWGNDPSDTRRVLYDRQSTTFSTAANVGLFAGADGGSTSSIGRASLPSNANDGAKTIHWRVNAWPSGALTDSGTATIARYRDRTTWTIESLTPGGAIYVLQASFSSDYSSPASFAFATGSISVPGVEVPNARMGQFARMWREVLDLTDFDMFTGDLPSGYAGGKAGDPAPVVRVSAMLSGLAARCSAVAFERSDGSWVLKRKDLLEACKLGAPVQELGDDDALLLEDTSSFERADAAVTGYSFTAYAGVRQSAAVTVGSQLGDKALAEQYGERVEGVPSSFIIVVEADGSLDAMQNDIASGAPRVLEVRTTGHNDKGGLWAAEPGDCINVTVDGKILVCTLLNRNVRFTPGGVGEHRLQCWVHAEKDAPVKTPPALLWEDGGNIELESGSRLLLEV